jgi:glycolate oxidase FAD binding subunit
MMTPEALQTRLEAVVGCGRVCIADPQTAAFAIDACKPAVVVCPETLEQAADIVTLAGRERLALVPWGQGTQMHLGQVPQRYDLALSLAGLTRMIEYDVANLTVLAEAGVPLREIYKVSVPERQFLPLGFPGTSASLGGLLVTNTSGVKRARYGGLRDLLLGVRVVLPDGSLVRFGGRVVKNVAGYDMNKLFIGSLGVFGVVLETVYRLAALPEDDRVLAVVFPTLAQATAAAAAVQGSQLLPSALMLLNAEAVMACPAVQTLSPSAPQVMLWLNFDGTYEAVERQVRDSQALCQQHGGLQETLLTGEALLKLWEFQEGWRGAPEATKSHHATLGHPCRACAHSGLHHVQPVSQARMDPFSSPWLQVRLGILPGRLQEAISLVSMPQPFLRGQVHWLADYSSGQIFARLPLLPSLSIAMSTAVGDWLRQVRTQLRHWHGYCVVEYAPAALRQQLDVWGETPGQQLLRLYKQQFDPYSVLNPGRYVAGL